MHSNFREKLRKIWKFVWEDDSPLSWIVNILIAFVLVKFIIYPGLGLFLGTTHPVVAVVSGSMEHDGNFEEWWASQSDWYENHNINKEAASKWSFSNGFNKGDIMILNGENPKDIDVGDVIVFKTNSKDPIIHRVVKRTVNKDDYIFQTKGDHNKDIIRELGEDKINKEMIIGKAVFRVPLLGWIKIIVVDLIKTIGGS